MNDDNTSVRSWRFRISSWLSLVLIIAFGVTHRQPLFYAGIFLWFAAVLPMLTRTRNRRLNFNDKADKRALLFTVLYAAGTIAIAVLWSLYGTRH